MSRGTLSRLLTFAEVADMMGEKGADRIRRVRRRLLAHEHSDDMLVRLGNRSPAPRGDGKTGAYGARYLVSLAALRAHMPQLRDPVSDVVPLVRAEVQNAVGELDDRVTELRDEIEAVAREAARRIATLQAEVTHLTAVVTGGRRAV